MKLRFTIYGTLFLLALASVWSDVANAQSGLANVCSGPDCSACHLVDLGNRLVTWLIGIITMLFAVLMVISGFGLVTSGGNQSALQSAKDRFVNAIIGFLIVIGAWLLIDTLMRGLVGQDGRINGRLFWAEVECWQQSANANLPETRVEPPGAITGTYGYVDSNGFISAVPVGNASAAGSGLSDAAVKQMLSEAGIEYKDSVSGQGLRPHVVSELVALDQACNCDITITSLTDGSHAQGTFSHANGFKADIRSTGGGDPNPELVRYVQSLPSAGTWSDGTKLHYDASSCATYALEATHIDVQFKTGC